MQKELTEKAAFRVGDGTWKKFETVGCSPTLCDAQNGNRIGVVIWIETTPRQIGFVLRSRTREQSIREQRKQFI